MLNLFSNSNEENVILIDIGNGTITGALAVFERQNKPKFTYIIKKFFNTQEKIEIKKFESEMLSILDEIMSSIVKEAFKHRYFVGKSKKIKRVLISFSSPWFLSKTKSINLVNEKEFVVTESFLNNILSKEVKELEVEMEKDGGEGELEVIEKSIIHSKINGYVLDNSLGKNTKNFDASLYMSVVGKNFTQKITEIIHRHTHLSKENVILHTFPLVLFTVVRDLFMKESSFLLMDITSEITDITLVKEDIIDKTVSFPYGKNFILRQISKNLNVSNEIADSTLKLYVTNKLGHEQVSKINEILASVEKEWAIYLENTLLEISPNMILPNSVFITSDSDIAQIYIDFLEIQKLDATANFRKNLKSTYVDLEKLRDFYENLSGFVLDEFVVILSIFYSRQKNFTGVK